jgi:hypothetical protein
LQAAAQQSSQRQIGQRPPTSQQIQQQQASSDRGTQQQQLLTPLHTCWCTHTDAPPALLLSLVLLCMLSLFRSVCFLNIVKQQQQRQQQP